MTASASTASAAASREQHAGGASGRFGAVIGNRPVNILGNVAFGTLLQSFGKEFAVLPAAGAEEASTLSARDAPSTLSLLPGFIENLILC